MASEIFCGLYYRQTATVATTATAGGCNNCFVSLAKVYLFAQIWNCVTLFETFAIILSRFFNPVSFFAKPSSLKTGKSSSTLSHRTKRRILSRIDSYGDKVFLFPMIFESQNVIEYITGCKRYNFLKLWQRVFTVLQLFYLQEVSANS